jgi:hypothetical protein
LPLAHTNSICEFVWCLPWSANCWIGCWSRYVFWIRMIFFYTICRSLNRTFLPTTYELVLRIRMSAQHIMRTRIILVCWPHKNSYIMAAKYYEFICLPHTNSYMAVKYYEFVCFQLYKFNTTNSYVTNQKKLAIEKNTNSYETALAYRKKKTTSIKTRAPPWSQVCGNLYIYYENISDTNQKRWIVRIFLYKDNPKNHLKKEIVRIHSWCI